MDALFSPTGAIFSGFLERGISSPEFESLKPEQKSIGVNEYINNFIENNNVTDEDKKAIYDVAAHIFKKYKADHNLPRFTPTEKEASDYYKALDLSSARNDAAKIIAVDKWNSESYEQAKNMRPGDADDFQYHLDAVSNDLIRHIAGRDTGFVNDKISRSIESAFKPLAKLMLGERDSERFFAEYGLNPFGAPENPVYDSNYSSSNSFVGPMFVLMVVFSPLLFLLLRLKRRRWLPHSQSPQSRD
jgi:hypothetical protein